MKIKLRITR